MKGTTNGLWEGDVSGLNQMHFPFSRWIQNCLNTIRNFFHAMNDSKIIALILIINGLIVAVYLIIHLCRRQWKKGVLLSIFMLSMPIIGPLYLLFGELLRTIRRIFGVSTVNMADLSFSKSRVRQILEADVEKESNVVPLEEALIVSGQDEKRQTFLDMIKGGTVENLDAIRNAVVDPDQEIAHYAASYVTDVLTRVKQQEVTLRNAFEENRTPQTCDSYMRHLRHALSMGIFEGMERRRFLERLENAYLWQLDNAPQNCTIEDMTFLMRQWLYLRDMEKAKQWFERIQPMRFEDLDALKACAVYFYRSQDREALLALLGEVRGSALELDNEALEWIRFFEQATGMRQVSGGHME